MRERMDHDKARGFVVSTEALDYYIGQIVNPALDNFEHIASVLSATTGSSHSTMLGHAKLAGSTEFTDSCKRMLAKFFDAHHMLTESQQALVRTVTGFRDNLQQSSAAYARNEASNAQSITSLSRQVESRLHSDGATG